VKAFLSFLFPYSESNAKKGGADHKVEKQVFKEKKTGGARIDKQLAGVGFFLRSYLYRNAIN
jgi:hypothetical protein